MILWMIVRTLIIMALFATTLRAEVHAEDHPITVVVEGDNWRLTRYADHCAERVPAAIADYQKEPIYHARRAATGDRYLVNDTQECWVELSIAGVHDVSLVFKVSEDQVVLDRRVLSWWGYEVSPYPVEPNGL